MAKTKKSNQKIKNIFAARSFFCKDNVAVLKDIDLNNKCLCTLDSVNLEYALAYTKTHLDIKKFDCGCRIVFNKYYPEFNYSRYVWNDFFDIPINSQKNTTAVCLTLLK